MDSLFGIKHSNRVQNEHLGKNQFNSSFPTALANYMGSTNRKVMYNTLIENEQGELKVETKEISVDELFGKKTGSELYFSFETPFEPYQKYSFDRIDGIDLAIKTIDGDWLRPLEIKLTVLPTSNTSAFKEEDWGSELVVRSATTLYCALGMYSDVEEQKNEIREIFEESCSNIQSWDNNFEVTNKYETLKNALNKFEKLYLNNQKPLLMQTLWKTEGQSPILQDDTLDIIVWSDYAISRLFIDSNVNKNEMSRPMRATAKLARCLWELSKSGKIHKNEIYRQMAFGNQTDKEFAISGTKWREYVTDKSRIIKPLVNKDELENIISSEYIDLLQPERRFDQSLYFTYRMR